MKYTEILIDKKHRIRVRKDHFALMVPRKATEDRSAGWQEISWHVDLVHAVRSITQRRMSRHARASSLDDFIKEYRSIHSDLMKRCALYFGAK